MKKGRKLPMITSDDLAQIAGTRSSLLPELARWINAICPNYGIDTPQEYAHFLAQACHETDHFRTLREYASGLAYEGRKDLGNFRAGDGSRFKGRGIFQTTGRANYLHLGVRRGRQDLFVKTPELLEKPEYAVWSACEFWQSRNLNDIANFDDADRLKKKYRGKVIEVSPVEYISMAINGGRNGLAKRKAFYLRAKEVLS
jgi:putative chitinase